MITEKLYKVVTPPSESDSFAESYEYMLIWTAQNGGVHQYLFFDANVAENVRQEAINTEKAPTKLISKHERFIDLSAHDVNLNEIETLQTITSA